MATENLIIEVTYNDHDAVKQVDALTSSINALNTATTGKGFKTLGDVSKSMAELAQAASGLDGIGKKFSDIADSSRKLFDTFKSFDPKEYSGNIKSLVESLNSISNAVGNLSQKGAGLQSVIGALKQLPSAVNTDIGKKTNLSGMSSAAKSTEKVFKDLGDGIKKVAKAGWELGKMPFKMILSPIQKVGQGLMSMTNRFTTFLKGIGRIALYRAIRTGIKLVTSAVREGVNNLYIWAGMVGNSFKPTMDSLATSFLYLKNSIGAMVSPLLDALAPALETVVNQIVDVLNIFNQVIATMTGATTWRKALRAPASYADNISGLGHDAEDANDAVKELKRTILGFDEINKLEDKTKTTVPKNNGKNATGYYAKQGAFSFEEVPIGKTALDIAKMLKDAWEKADFTSIGDLVAKKIAGVLNDIDWDKVKSFTTKFSKSLGTFLSGLLDYNGSGGKALWDAVAKTIYNGINTAILGYTTFFDSVKWEGIGEGIGAAVAKVCKNINWTKGKNSLGDALAKFPNAVIDVLTGFTKKFTAKDFYNLGNNVGKAVTKALTKIKWKELFTNTITIATGILSAFNGLLEGIKWADIKNAILNGIKAVPKKTWAALGTQIGNAIFNVADFIANMADTLIKAVESGKWKDLITGIWTGIDKKVKAKYGSWGEAAKQLGSWIIKHMGSISALLSIAIGISKLKSLAGALLSGKIMAGMVTSAPLVGGGTLATLGTLSSFLTACAIAIPIGVTVTPIVMEKVDDLVQKFVDTMDPIINPTVQKVTDFLTNKNYKPNKIYTGGATAGEKGAPSSTTVKRDFGNGASVWQMPSGDLNLPNLNYDKALAAARKRVKNAVTSGVSDAATEVNKNTGASSSYAIKPKLDPKAGPDAFTQLVTWWSQYTKTNKVGTFSTKGLKNEQGKWNSQLTGPWGRIVQTKVAEFKTAGLKNESSTWRGQLDKPWNLITATTVSMFKTAGLKNEKSTWAGQLTTFWAQVIATALPRFSTAGVKNEGKKWKTQMVDYWTEATKKTVLKIAAAISNAKSAAKDARTIMKNYFEANPLSIKVTANVKQATQAAVNASKSYQQTGTSSGTKTFDILDIIKKGKATGGVYKNGQWHDVTAFASGGMPGNSGQVFLAREAGPELVGTIGGNTAVLNNDQIVASVSAGVAQAVASVLGGGNTNEITINVDSETLYRAVRKGERMASGRYGTAIAIG